MTDTERIDWLEQQYGGAIISDDNGHWAFASDGFQNCPMKENEVFDLSSTFLVEKHAFKDTVRDAIDHAIEVELKEYD